MTKNHKISLRGLAFAFMMTASASLALVNAMADQRFQKWIADFIKLPFKMASASNLSQSFLPASPHPTRRCWKRPSSA